MAFWTELPRSFGGEGKHFQPRTILENGRNE
jgi:hypothetical protein